MKAKCKKCNEAYPQKRKDLGYDVCVNCSTEKGWSCSALTFHKTGNTIEVIKDPEVAYNLNQMASRKSFGVMSGITGRYKKWIDPDKEEEQRSNRIDETGKTYEVNRTTKGVLPGKTINYKQTGRVAMDILDNDGMNEAISFVTEEYKQLRLSPSDFTSLIGMIRILGKS